METMQKYLWVGKWMVGLVLVVLPLFAQEKTQSPHGDIKWDCMSCHTTQSWDKLRSPMLFAHSETGFELEGAHQDADCMSCHENLQFKEVGTVCADCHTDVHREQFGTDCQTCHTPEDWASTVDIKSVHNERGFPLTGVHAIADCQACHLGEQHMEFAGTSTECSSCHISNFMQTTSPSHTRAGFDMQCMSCHEPTARKWEETNFVHTETFQLRGAHTTADCNSCHANTFAGTSGECASCHMAEYQQTTAPPHMEFGFPSECQVCHTEEQWEGAVFDHLQRTGFALLGVHASLQCASCHGDNQFTGIPRDCFGCHQEDFNSTLTPNHVQGNFPTDCALCHNNNGWAPADFNHDLTQFPLTGAHQTIECADCHDGGVFTALPTDCFSCHNVDFNNTLDPNHVSNNFNHDCTQCHNTTAWTPANFDHANTQFPLTGAHVPLECVACHANGYDNTPIDCFSCHQTDFNGVSEPNHVTNNFSTDCTMCHNTDAWNPATFDHANTNFPLTGAHVPLPCIACHSEGYTNTPSDCFSCHQNDFTGVADPDHVANNFSHDCTMCHNTNGWTPVMFDHANTDFPLTGAHVNVQCIDCHSDGYNNTPTDCYSCHQNDFTGVADPDHVANNFSHDCTQCHTTDGWTPAFFDHNQTNFPLTGAHLNLQCIDCHSNGYDNTPTDCFSCHQDDYNNTTDPDHQAANFPTDCEQCHSTNNWNDVTWDHDGMYFPIYSGAHHNKWDTCADCHVDPNNFAVFECIFCHEHNQQDMDNEHSDVSDYQYNSQACYSCHPNGNAKMRMFRGNHR